MSMDYSLPIEALICFVYGRFLGRSVSASKNVRRNGHVSRKTCTIRYCMERMIEDVRRSVGGLRSSNAGSRDLAEALARIPQELCIENQIDFRVMVLGSARQLHPIIHEETYCIGREALLNAVRHSRASRIEVELEYGAKRFSLGVRDNGCGIDPQMLRSGRDGHWGLAGMRERAEKMGANLRVQSRIANGTDVVLSIPNRIAFERACS